VDWDLEGDSGGLFQGTILAIFCIPEALDQVSCNDAAELKQVVTATPSW
jgi:hypothetical protein